MAESRTEQPTARRQAEARAEGRVAVSGELSFALALLAAAGASVFFGERLLRACRGLLEHGLSSVADPARGLSALTGALHAVALALLPLLLCVAVAAALGGFLQVGPLWAGRALSPRAERLSPAERLRALPERLRALGWDGLRSMVLALTALALALQLTHGLFGLSWSSPERSLAVLGSLVLSLVLWLAGIALVLGLADLVLRVLRHRRGLMTSRSELSRELRESYGLPEHRAQRRRLAEQATAQANAAAVAQASVLLLDERGRALALAFDEDDPSQLAPRVIAKGEGITASRMHAAAEAAEVPVALAPWLVAALYRLELGEALPVEHHAEVAEHMLAGRRP